MSRQAESGHWPATEGVVEESWIARVHAEDTPRYTPHVCYRYRVGEKEYRNGSIDTPGFLIYTTWPGFDPDRFRILWEQVRGDLENRGNVGG